jgi:hypothetical protein
MTPFPSRSYRSQKLSAPLAALALLFLAACSDKHIGRPCNPYNMTPPVDGGVDPNSAIVNTETLECPSRICLLPAAQVSTDTKAFCTDECGSDDDCAGGESRGKGMDDFRCESGFVCSYVVPKLPDATTPLQCKKLCVCKDFLVSGKASPLPEGCGT